MLSAYLPYIQFPILGTVSQLKMSELKGKYSPYFELIVDNIKNKRYLKCKVCGDGTTLAYNGNTSSMKAHLEAKHKTEYKTVVGGLCQLVKWRALSNSRICLSTDSWSTTKSYDTKRR